MLACSPHRTTRALIQINATAHSTATLIACTPVRRTRGYAVAYGTDPAAEVVAQERLRCVTCDLVFVETVAGAIARECAAFGAVPTPLMRTPAHFMQAGQFVYLQAQAAADGVSDPRPA